VSHKLVAFVPMRHDSERVPGKNYRPLAGKPLFHHIVSTLLAVPEIDLVAIDTDSPAITADAADAFPGALVIDRPAHLLGGDVPMNEILRHDVDVVEADLYLQTHSTNPLLRPATISAAIEAFQAARHQRDSLFGVTPLHTRLWTEDGQPLNHDPNVLMRTQDLPPVLEENSCLYIFTADGLRRRGNRIGERPLLYPIDRAEAWDIDDEVDWTVVEALVSRERQS
jgi:CMP-N-acetylneuraminic acid synthetase